MGKGTIKYLLLGFLLLTCSCVQAYQNNIKPYENYLIVLVHGINGSVKSFEDYGNLKGYLENELGLKGHVYAYGYSDPKGSSIISAKELGDPSHGNPKWAGAMPDISNENVWKNYTSWEVVYNNHSWITQSVEYYKTWFKWQNPSNSSHRDPLPNEVPSKIILIAHSMGGLSTRYYICSNYYNNDVKKLITVDSPHLGADGVTWYKNYKANELSKALSGAIADYFLKTLIEKAPYLANSFDDIYVASGHWTTNFFSKSAYNYLLKEIKGDTLNIGGNNLPISYDVKNSPSGFFDDASLDVNLQLRVGAEQTIKGITETSRVNLLGLKDFPLNLVEQWGASKLFWLTILNWWESPGLDEMDPDSDLINYLKSAVPKRDTNPIEFRLISARGVPTPHKELVKQRFWFTPFASGLVLPFMSEYQGLPSEGAKVYSAFLTTAIPGVWAVKDGSLLVAVDSSRAEGVKMFEDNTKRYEYTFKYENLDGAAEFAKAEWEVIIAGLVLTGQIANPGLVSTLMVIPTVHLAIMETTALGMDSETLFAHGQILNKIKEGTPNIIDLSLFDEPIVNVSSLETDISIEAYNSSQTIVHTNNVKGVKIENLSQSTLNLPNNDYFVPFLLDSSHEAYLEPLLVKTPVTQIKGVIYDFKPLDLKEFLISENFAGWQDFMKPGNIKERTAEKIRSQAGKFTLEIDNWGRYTISGFDFAEGQNVVAFKLKNRALYTSNQILKVTQNTIPQWASQFKPLYVTNNDKPPIGCEFNKSGYSTTESELININTFRLDGADIPLNDPNMSISKNRNDYGMKTIVEYKPSSPLSEGEHNVVVAAQSNIGTSQGIWPFIVDRTAPVVSVEALAPYSARAPAKPLNILYRVSDNYSTFIKNLSFRLYKGSDTSNESNFVCEITTVPTQAAGEGFVSWNSRVADDSYTIKVKAYDEAGNYSVTNVPIEIDSSPPVITAKSISPNPMTSNSSSLSASCSVSENATVIFKLTDKETKVASGFMSNVIDGQAKYSWDYSNNSFGLKGPDDGVYDLEIIAQDKAGNEGIVTIESVRIDRTGPVIANAMCQPFVLMNSGDTPYTTNLTYTLKEDNDKAANKKGIFKTRVKLYNENTGEPLKTWDPALNPLVFNGSNSSYGKGAYKFQIISEDDVGNVSYSFASVVKDGVAPVISFPASGQTVSGTIAIRGTAMDPDWTNSLPFKQYRIYYAQGSVSPTTNPGSEWKTDFVEVPEVNRDPATGIRNQSIRPLQNDSTLAYLYTNALPNGTYTIMVVVDEEGGEALAAARTITIANDAATASIMDAPAVQLGQLPASITFNGSNSLPISFINSIKPANVHLEIQKGNRTVYYKYFPGVPGSPYMGKPDYEAGKDLGYFIWMDETGWHIRWSSDGGNHHFVGNMAASNLSDFQSHGDGISQMSNMVSWDKNLSGGEGGIDFRTSSNQIVITAQMDEDPLNPSIFVDYVNLGMTKLKNQTSVVILNVGPEAGFNSIAWNGMLDTGGFVDNGNYTVRVRAEGADGMGLSVTEEAVSVITPLEIKNVALSPWSYDSKCEFNPAGAPDRVSVYYNLSKDAKVTAKVYRDGVTDSVAVLSQGLKLGRLNPDNCHVLSWRGNYPDDLSSEFYTEGKFYIVLEAEAADGSGTITQRVPASPSLISIKPATGSALAYLEPLGTSANVNGDEKKIVGGDSSLYFDILGKGKYYPPLPYLYKLNLRGNQSVNAHPYVPFALLVHRGFKDVNVQVQVIAHIQWTQYGYVFLQGWKGEDKWATRTYSNTFTLNDANPITLPISDQYKVWDFKSWQDFSTIGVLAGEPYPHINKINLEIYVRPARDTAWYLDKQTINSDDYGVNSDLPDSISPADPIPTEKGVFEIYPTWEHWWGTKFGMGPRFSLRVELADPVKYSRLTNRFVPWFGFVSKKNPKSASDNGFAGYTNWLEKLGFPGRTYFETGKIDLAYNSDYPHDLAEKLSTYNIPSSESSLAKPDMKLISEARSRWAGNVEPEECYSYLDRNSETLEIVVITKPEQGDFKFPNTGDLVTDNNKIDKFIVRKINNERYPDSIPIEAKTTLDADPSMFQTTWPPPSGYIDGFRNTYGTTSYKYYDLMKNPQNYTGPTKDGTYFDLEGDIKQSAPSVMVSRVLRYDKAKGQYYDKSEIVGLLLTGEALMLDKSYYVTDLDRQDIILNLSSNEADGKVVATTNNSWQDWTTSADSMLASWGGKIKGRYGFDLEAAPSGTSPDIKIYDFYSPRVGSQTFEGLADEKYTFWKYNPLIESETLNPADNPNLAIDDYEVALVDVRGSENQDFELANKIVENDHFKNDRISVKIHLDAKGKKYAEIRGRAGGPYELIYFDGEKWKTFERSSEGKNGVLGYWDVNRLCGNYTVLLKVYDAADNYSIASTNVLVGELVKKGDANTDNLHVSSTYNRAQLKFHPDSFGRDEVISIAPVSADEADVKNRPIIQTIGPIAEIKPSPASFEATKRPTLTFRYTEADLLELYPALNVSDPAAVRGLGLNIHQITGNGDLELIDRNKQEFGFKGDSLSGKNIYLFTADLDHFSDYTVLEGDQSLKAPDILTDRLITNQTPITVYGTAAADSYLDLFVFKSSGAEISREANGIKRTRADGNSHFVFNDINLTEGNNYIVVTSRRDDDPGSFRTRNEINVVYDIFPPTVEASSSLKAFSPNGDGKYDSITYTLRSSEKGKIHFILRGENKTIIDQEIDALAKEEIKLVWKGQSFEIRKANSTVEYPIGEQIKDGLHAYTVFAVDEAGNISDNIDGRAMVDLAPPRILGMNAAPNPFTPDGDGVKDKTKFWYKLSEPSVVTTQIFREDGIFYRKYAQTIGDFSYPALMITVSTAEGVVGGWSWDGSGARNEMLGGNFSYHIVAEDAVGNSTSSEAKIIIVDREHFLVGYLYADPDIFSPVNSSNDKSAITYYLGSDNLKVNLSILNSENQMVKRLAVDTLENKGEHKIIWDGSYEPYYSGLKAARNQNKVYNGGYTIKLRAEEVGGGRTTEVTSIVDVDNDPPSVTLRPVVVDYAGKKASLRYVNSEKAAIEVKLFDLDNNYVETIYSSDQDAGEHSIDYLWSNPNRRPQNYFEVVATDKAMNKAETRSETFSVVPIEELSITNLSASNNPFTPNGDALKDQTRISYRISGGVPEYKVNLYITNAAGATVKYLIRDELQGTGTNSIYWDGRTENADPTIVSYAPDGDYIYQLVAEDKLGTRIAASGTIRLVSTKPVVNISVDPVHISPDTDSPNGSAWLSYSINYSSLWIDEPAQVKIDVINSSSEAVFTKTFSHTPGSYVYKWDGRSNQGWSAGNTVEAGAYYVFINATDAIGTSALPKSDILYVDYTSPAPSDFSISPLYAKLGAKVSINLKFDEALSADPDVKIFLPDQSAVIPALLESADGNSYLYSYTIGNEDKEGIVTVSVEAKDLSQNEILRAQTFVIDKTDPQVSAAYVLPDPAKAGTAEVNFTANEPLYSARVKVTQNGASPIECPVNGEWLNYGGKYTARYTVPPDIDLNGTAEVTIEVWDRATNYSKLNTTFEVDTVSPNFSNIKTYTSEFHQGSYYAKKDAVAEIHFDASEPLKFNPEVKVNDKDATYSEQLPASGEVSYIYKYTVNPNDDNGLATIKITGYDFAYNLGENAVSSNTQSFIIDLATPETTINDFIVSQNPFSPNNDSYQDTTSFLFDLSEDVYLTIKVYTYDANKNYSAGNLVKTICEGQLIIDHQQIVPWDGSVNVKGGYGDANDNGFVDKGGYAYIVEARDRAGNIAIKRGGTMWVQDMPLTLQSSNLSRDIFSSSGNSPNKEIAADYWLTAEYTGEVKVPEKIEIFSIGHSRPIGIVTIEVRDASNKLVKVLTSETGAETQKISVRWDGTDSSGMPVNEGIYYMVASALDLTGIPAAIDPATSSKMVVVDNTEPDINISSISNRYISPNSTQPTAIKDTVFNYQLADNLSSLSPGTTNEATVSIEIYKDSNLVNTLVAAETKEATGSLVAQTPVGWVGDLPGEAVFVGSENVGGVFSDGEYTIKITAVDRAGNLAYKTDTFTIDTVKPMGNVEVRRSSGAASEYTNNTQVRLIPTPDDANPDKMRFSNDGSIFSDWESLSPWKDWNLTAVDGTKQVYASYLDKAGNLSIAEIKDSITLDTQKPRIVSAPEPLPVTRQRVITNLSMSLSDLNSGVDSGIVSWQLVINNSSGSSVKSFTGSGNSVSFDWDATGVTDGNYYYYIVATDGAGNTLRSYESGYGPYQPYSGSNNTYYRVIVDQTAPTAGITSPDINNWVWYGGTINIYGTASDANPGGYTVSYSPHNTNPWTAISNAVYPVEARLSENTLSVDPTLECEAKVSVEAGSQYLGDVSVNGSAFGWFPPPNGNPPVYQEFDVTEVGMYLFETYGNGNGFVSNHYLQDLSGRDIISPLQQINQSQIVPLGPGRYRVAVNMQIRFMDGQMKVAGSRLKKSTASTTEEVEEKAFTLDKKQKIKFEPYYSGVGTYGSEQWLYDSLGQVVAYVSNPQSGNASYPLLDAGSYRVKVRGWASGDGSSVNAGARIYTNYGEWVQTATLNVQYEQDVLVEGVPGASMGGAGSEHWLLDSGGNPLFYYLTNDSWASRRETIHLQAGTYTLKTKGWASFGQNYSYTRASAQKNNVVNGILAQWNTRALSDGDYDLRMEVTDKYGNSNQANIQGLKIDNTPPTVTVQSITPNPFNPYADGTVTIKLKVEGENCGELRQFAYVYSSDERIKIAELNNVEGVDYENVLVTPGSDGELFIKWNGKNGNGDADFVNEGDYMLRITIRDKANNQTTVKPIVQLRDDVNISKDSANSSDPYLIISGNTFNLNWMEGAEPYAQLGPATVYAESDAHVWPGIPVSHGSDTNNFSDPFNIDVRQEVTIRRMAYGSADRDYVIFKVLSDNTLQQVVAWGEESGENGTSVWEWGSEGALNHFTLDAGTYRLKVRAYANKWGEFAKTEMRCYYSDYRYNQYTCSSSDLGKNWEGPYGPTRVDSFSTGPDIDPYPFAVSADPNFQPIPIGSITHKVSNGSDGNLYYSRGYISGYNVSPLFSLYIISPVINWGAGIKITNSGKASNPSIREDSSHNAYVAWVDLGNNNWDIFFQEIPFNFAPIKNTPSLSVIPGGQQQLTATQSATLETPTLIAPKDKTENVQSIRPTFEWKHHKADTTEYKIDLAKNDAFNIAPQSFTKSANTGSADKNDPNLYYFDYSIHEFDPGLDRDTYFWKVTALSTNEAATSEAWSFTIQPDLTLTGVTNYPNPFNPNKEKTKIRYRLSTDASEVKIRIYDITGSLVTELDGTTNGEGASIWNKYNDVEWDGRNGRGDMVVNGIYPFEIIARLGDKTISGRGKVAVLK